MEVPAVIVNDEVDVEQEAEDDIEAAVTVKQPTRATAKAHDSDDDEQRPSKKKTGSYLDELLAQKATKKKNKQKPNKTGSNIPT